MFMYNFLWFFITYSCINNNIMLSNVNFLNVFIFLKTIHFECKPGVPVIIKNIIGVNIRRYTKIILVVPKTPVYQSNVRLDNLGFFFLFDVFLLRIHAQITTLC